MALLQALWCQMGPPGRRHIYTTRVLERKAKIAAGAQPAPALACCRPCTATDYARRATPRYRGGVQGSGARGSSAVTTSTTTGLSAASACWEGCGDLARLLATPIPRTPKLRPSPSGPGSAAPQDHSSATGYGAASTQRRRHGSSRSQPGPAPIIQRRSLRLFRSCCVLRSNDTPSVLFHSGRFVDAAVRCSAASITSRPQVL
jgi:hypothetical protein